MTTIVIIILGLVLVFWIGYIIGEDKGYQQGEQWGRLDQHWYQQGIEQKTRRK